MEAWERRERGEIVVGREAGDDGGSSSEEEGERQGEWALEQDDDNEAARSRKAGVSV